MNDNTKNPPNKMFHFKLILTLLKIIKSTSVVESLLK